MNKLLVLSKKLSKGFTLIELLIVIAVIGVLSAVVLVAIDPVQQLARGRDAGRKSSIGQLGRAIQAYYTANSVYPPVSGWVVSPNNVLETSGEIKAFPSNPTYSVGGLLGTPCTVNIVAGYCYAVIGSPITDVVVYARLESKSENGKCTVSPNFTGWYVFSSAAGRSGGRCLAGATEPIPPSSTFDF